MATILSEMRTGVSRRAACGAAGVTLAVLRSWLQAGARGDEACAEFARDVLRAEAEPERSRVRSLMAAGDEDWRAALAWLERARGEDWKPRQGVSVEADLERMLDAVESVLGEEDAARVFEAIAGDAGGGETD